MAERIEIDYEQMANIASQFEERADVIELVIDRVEGALDVLRNGGWTSEAATQYYNEMDSDLMPGVNRLHQALLEAATITRNIVNTMEEAEDQAANAFPATSVI